MNDFILDNVKKMEQMILEGNYPCVSDFVKRLGVIDKTARRYIKFMREKLYLPIEYDSHQKGFYYANTNRTLQSFFAESPSYEFKEYDEKIQIQRRNELLNILISNVTSKGLAHSDVDEETKEHIRSTERNLKSCKTAEEIVLYYDFSLRAKTGQKVAEELRRNGLLCFESPEIAEQVEKFKK